MRGVLCKGLCLPLLPGHCATAHPVLFPEGQGFAHATWACGKNPGFRGSHTPVLSRACYLLAVWY